MTENGADLPYQQDREHLRLLSIFHYVVGGLAGAVSLCFVPHLLIGGLLSSGALNGGPSAEARIMGVFFMLVPLVMMLGAWALAGATIVAGRYLRMERNWTYCLVVAAVLCAFAPFGTVLGVFTIIVLLRPSVKDLFQASQSAA
jgi:hypothetical protein